MDSDWVIRRMASNVWKEDIEKCLWIVLWKWLRMDTEAIMMDHIW